MPRPTTNKFQPAVDVERDLVDEMVIAKWRQRRDWSNEAALLDLEMDHQTQKLAKEYKKIDHACRFALAFRALADESKALVLSARYETSYRRAYHRALTTLLQPRAAQKPPVDEPIPSEEQPATSNQKPTTNYEQRTTNNELRATAPNNEISKRTQQATENTAINPAPTKNERPVNEP